jgi:hypothetical protein
VGCRESILHAYGHICHSWKCLFCRRCEWQQKFWYMCKVNHMRRSLGTVDIQNRRWKSQKEEPGDAGRNTSQGRCSMVTSTSRLSTIDFLSVYFLSILLHQVENWVYMSVTVCPPPAPLSMCHTALLQKIILLKVNFRILNTKYVRQTV